MDLPRTLESMTEKSTNKHETFEFPQDSCPNKDSPNFISPRATCSHQDSNHLLNFPSKMYRRVVVDAFVYRKHSRFRGSTMALTLQLKCNQRMVVKVEQHHQYQLQEEAPRVKLMTLNKALPGDNPTIKKNPSLKKIIIRACFWYSMDLRIFLVTNPFRLRLRRTKDMRRPRPWLLFQLYTGYSLVI